MPTLLRFASISLLAAAFVAALCVTSWSANYSDFEAQGYESTARLNCSAPKKAVRHIAIYAHEVEAETDGKQRFIKLVFQVGARAACNLAGFSPPVANK